MKGKIIVLVICFPLMFLTSCVSTSIKVKDASYFVGKKAEKLQSYFDKNAIIKDIKNSDEEYYDSVLYCTNEVITYEMSKTKTISYKVEKTKPFYNFWFYKFQDGCMARDNHKKQDFGSNRIIHQNINGTINSELNYFYKIVNGYESYDVSKQQWAFDNHRIGATYYLYQIQNQGAYFKGFFNADGSGTLGENAVTWYYNLWEVNLVEEKKYSTETYNLYYYYCDENYYDNTRKITREETEKIVRQYLNNGYTINENRSGISLIAYIKNGIIENVKQL